MFFTPSPGLPLHDKARLEFHLQHLSEFIGLEPMRLPVWLPMGTFGHDCTKVDPNEVLKTVGQHLHHDVGPISISIDPKSMEKCGSGG